MKIMDNKNENTNKGLIPLNTRVKIIIFMAVLLFVGIVFNISNIFDTNIAYADCVSKLNIKENNDTDYILSDEITVSETFIETEMIVQDEIYSVKSDLHTNIEIKQLSTTYNGLTDEEINLIEKTVQHEVGNFSNLYKQYVAEIIYNRLYSNEFPNTVEEVLFQEGQFPNINNWINDSELIPNEDVIAVVAEVFTNDNPSHNCTYYYNPEMSDYSAVQWFEYSGDVDFIFSYTEESWGIEYETRFFKESQIQNNDK